MLELKCISVSIDSVPVLRDVSFALLPGRATVLIGRNGAGKTTTLRTIMGLLTPKLGTLRIGDTDLLATPSHRRAWLGIGYAPEDRRLIPSFSVEENILLPALVLDLPPDERRQRLDEVYRLLPELVKMKDRPGGGVSGGQGKMVALGRALMVARTLLLLDEPFQGLAPALALDYARTLARLREEKSDLTLLITESSPNLLKAVADETLRIERGAIEPA